MARVRTLIPVGEEIRARRLELGLTPEQLVLKLPGNTHPQTIRKLERGATKKASELLIHQLARALGTKATEISRKAAA